MIALLLVPVIYLGFKFMGQEKNNSEKNYNQYDGLFQYYGGVRGVPWEWIKAIAKVESDLGNNPLVKSGKASYDGLSYGLMQIAEGVGSPKEILLKGHGGREKLNNPDYSIEKASDLLGYLNVKYHGDMDKVFLAYNQGERNTDNGKDYTTKYHPDGVSYKERVKKALKWVEARK